MFTDTQILNALEEAGLKTELLNKGVYRINGKFNDAKRNIQSEVKDLVVSDRKGLKCKVSGKVIFKGKTYTFNNDSAEVNILKRVLKIKTKDCNYEYSLKTNSITKY